MNIFTEVMYVQGFMQSSAIPPKPSKPSKPSKLVKSCREAFKKTASRVRSLFNGKAKAKSPVQVPVPAIPMVDIELMQQDLVPLTPATVESVPLVEVGESAFETFKPQDQSVEPAYKAVEPEDQDDKKVEQAPFIVSEQQEVEESSESLGIDWLFSRKSEWPDRPIKSAVLLSDGAFLIIEASEDHNDQMFVRANVTGWGEVELVKVAPFQWSCELPIGSSKVEFAVCRMTSFGAVWLNGFEQNYHV